MFNIYIAYNFNIWNITKCALVQHCLGDFARLLLMQFTINVEFDTVAPVTYTKQTTDTGDYVPYSL